MREKPTMFEMQKLNGNGGQTYINQTIGMDPVFWDREEPTSTWESWS